LALGPPSSNPKVQTSWIGNLAAGGYLEGVAGRDCRRATCRCSLGAGVLVRFCSTYQVPELEKSIALFIGSRAQYEIMA
jgi:hypothetical protein